jgi:hypothetical protein
MLPFRAWPDVAGGGGGGVAFGAGEGSLPVAAGVSAASIGISGLVAATRGCHRDFRWCRCHWGRRPFWDGWERLEVGRGGLLIAAGGPVGCRPGSGLLPCRFG